MRLSATFAVVTGLLLAICAPAQAQDWPNRPIKVIVPGGAGGSGDILARVVAEHLSATFKHQFVVENRPGAGGMIATQQLAAASPDGYTIGITLLSTISLVPFINPAATYDPLKDLTHIAYIGGAPVVLGASPKTGVKSFKDFVAYAKEKKFTFVTAGVGSDGHLMGEAVARSTKVDVEHVPYKSASQALSDIVAGHVPFSTLTLFSTSQFLRSGQMNAVAITAPARMPDYPDLPTFKELGHPELTGTTWYLISGPAKLPADIVDKLNRAVTDVINRPDMTARLRRDGFITQPMTPSEVTAFVARENERWKPVIASAGLAKPGQ